MKNIHEQIRDFVQIFKPNIKEEIIPWSGNDAVGLSILRDYPDRSKFKPAKNKKGKNDSVTLIKIGYLSIDPSDNAQLYVSISKASRYLLKGHWDFKENEDDEEMPPKSSREDSKNSKQPIDLEENSRYVYNIVTKKIKDIERGKYVKPEEVVDDIYKLHLKTLSYTATFFRVKMLFQTKAFDIVGPIKEWLKWLNFIIFGRTITKSDDFSLGIFKMYSMKDLRALSDEKTKIFGSEFPITNHSARSLVIVTSTIFLVDYFWKYDILGVVALTNKVVKIFFFQHL